MTLKVNVGDKYGFLTIKKEVDKIGGRRAFECICDCGNVKNVVLNKLTTGNTKSCGCLVGQSHGMSHTKIYSSWKNMMTRCSDQSNMKYGGRGIEVCERWKSFNNFYDDMHHTYEDGLTIERIDVNGDYELSNCNWITNEQQQRNKRKRKDNISGVTGVCLVNGYYVSSNIDEHGIRKNVYFSTKTYGKDEAFRLACEYRNSSIEELRIHGIEYGESHGE